jgi:hypothetical protein
MEGEGGDVEGIEEIGDEFQDDIEVLEANDDDNNDIASSKGPSNGQPGQDVKSLSDSDEYSADVDNSESHTEELGDKNLEKKEDSDRYIYI